MSNATAASFALDVLARVAILCFAVVGVLALVGPVLHKWVTQWRRRI